MEEVDLRAVTRWGRVPAWWLLHPDVDADRFCVLAALATYADERGVCDPSQATLAKRLRRSRPWVNRVIAELVEVGLLRKTARNRANGGTTSCEYAIPLAPPGADARVTPVTRACPPPDTPRHGGDRNQQDVEQNQPARPAAHATDAEKSSERETPDGEADMLPKDWQPTGEIRGEAARLYPDADLDEHTALFVARCRSKRYRIPSGSADDTWLAWLIEDRRKARERVASIPAPRAAWPGSTGQGSRFDRFAAWGAVAEGVQGRSLHLDACHLDA